MDKCVSPAWSGLACSTRLIPERSDTTIDNRITVLTLDCARPTDLRAYSVRIEQGRAGWRCPSFVTKSGCLIKLVSGSGFGANSHSCGSWIVALNPWALHIGGLLTPLPLLAGTGTVVGPGITERNDVSAGCFRFWPGEPSGFSGGGAARGLSARARSRRHGLVVCCAGPRSSELTQRDVYGGYSSARGKLLTGLQAAAWRNAAARQRSDCAGVSFAWPAVCHFPCRSWSVDRPGRLPGHQF